VYSFHFFLVFSGSTRSVPVLSFIVPIFGRNPPLMFPIFLKRSLVFPLLLFSSIIKHSSLKKLFLSLLAIFLNSAFNRMYVSSVPCLPFSSSAVCKAPQITTLPSCFSLGWFCSPPRVQYYGCLSIVLQAHCYLDLVP